MNGTYNNDNNYNNNGKKRDSRLTWDKTGAEYAMREIGAITGVAIGAISGASLVVDAGVFSSEMRVSGFGAGAALGAGAGAEHARPARRTPRRICKQSCLVWGRPLVLKLENLEDARAREANGST